MSSLSLLLALVGAFQNPVFFDQAEVRGQVDAKICGEASGLVASRTHRDVLWTHNDSGAGPVIIALDTHGAVLSTVKLKGAPARDWEDIAIGENAAGGHLLYVADTGNNRAHDGSPHPNVRIYRVPEPTPARDGSTDKVENFDTLTLTYPDGAHDVEAVLLDPIDGALYFFTKRDPVCRVYRLADAAALAPGDYQLAYAGDLPPTMVTAADISPQGDEILIKTYAAVYYWRRQGTEPLMQALGRPGHVVGTYRIEPQGEAITFDPVTLGFYTLSEARDQPTAPLYYYAPKQVAASPAPTGTAQ